MTLLELEPHWMRVVDDRRFQQVDSITTADGIRFLCPVCFQKNGGRVGTHSVLCWRPHVPQSVTPAPGRWQFVGTGFDDLSLVANSSSILLMGGCNAHFFITKGQIC